MIKDEKPYITYGGKEYLCYFAGYVNPVQHKWQFIIDNIGSEIYKGEKIEFMGLSFTVTFTLRRYSDVTSCINNTSGCETLIEAWIINNGDR